MISTQEVLRRDGRPLECTNEQHLLNIGELVSKVNALFLLFEAHIGKNFPAIVTSGYRTPAINRSIKGAAKRSKHMSGQAVDIRDTDGVFAKYLLSGAGALAMIKCGLVLEHPNYTEGWVHLQTVSVESGANPFIPY